MSCPDANALLDFAAGRLGETTLAELDGHLDACPACRELVADQFGTRDVHPRPVAPAPKLRAGDRVGRFVVREPLGQGGMGVVYAAEDPELGRDVAIKLLRPRNDAVDRDASERLVREARALARVAHPNVVAVYDIGLVSDEIFVAMERVFGTTLRRWLAVARPRSPAEILAVFQHAAAGLAGAHACGIVHRDFKPDNVMIDDHGVARVMDFGLARLESSPSVDSQTSAETAFDSALTGTGTLMGTPAYMAPEQHDGGRVDAKSDQYAFCVSLFEALCGQLPFRHARMETLVAAKRAADFDFPAEAHLPRRLRRAIARGLSPSPARRFDSMDQLAAQLARATGAFALLGPMLAAFALVVGAVLYFGSARDDGCQRVGDELVLDWTSTRRVQLAAALERSLPPDAARVAGGNVDDWVERWSATHTRACDDRDDRELTCLAHRREALLAALDVLDGHGSEGAVHTGDLLADIGDPDACAGDIDSTPVVTPAVEVALARASAFESMGQYAQARDAASRAIELAEAASDPGGRLQALLELAYALAKLEAWSEALATAEQAYTAAEAAGDPVRAAGAAMRCVFVLTHGAADLPGAARWLRHAEAAVERAGSPPELAIRLAVASAREARIRGAHTAARGHLERVIGTVEQREPALLSSALSDLAIALAESGDLVGALTAFERARAVIERQNGADHPAMSEAEANIGATLVAVGDLNGGLAAIDRAVTIERGSRSPRIGRLGHLEMSRGAAQFHAGKWLDAEASNRRAIAHLQAAQLGPHPLTALASYNLALCLIQLERRDDAEATLRGVVETLEFASGPKERKLVGPLDALADLAHDRGDYEQAVALRRRAVAVVAADPMPGDAHAADARLGLALDLIALDRPNEAEPELESALVGFESSQSTGTAAAVTTALSELGRLRLRTGRAAQAVADLERASALLEHEPLAPKSKRTLVAESLAEARAQLRTRRR